MLFLTHLKGPLTATWAASMSRDLTNRVQTRVNPRDEQLWTHMFQSFRRQYANNQEQERAENTLQRGIRMQGEDLDAYIAKYEGLVLEAGFNLRDRLCLKMFTDGLPHDLYRDILQLDNPRNYDKWKDATLLVLLWLELLVFSDC
jgi:hypothetical protein